MKDLNTQEYFLEPTSLNATKKSAISIKTLLAIMLVLSTSNSGCSDEKSEQSLDIKSMDNNTEKSTASPNHSQDREAWFDEARKITQARVRAWKKANSDFLAEEERVERRQKIKAEQEHNQAMLREKEFYGINTDEIHSKLEHWKLYGNAYEGIPALQNVRPKETFQNAQDISWKIIPDPDAVIQNVYITTTSKIRQTEQVINIHFTLSHGEQCILAIMTTNIYDRENQEKKNILWEQEEIERAQSMLQLVFSEKNRVPK